MTRLLVILALGLPLLAVPSGCGARTGLPDEKGGSGGFVDVLDNVGGAGAIGGSTAAGGAGQAGSSGNTLTCEEGATQSCGSDTGACQPGIQICHDGVFGPCHDAIGPSPEVCNGLDDNCDGNVDEGFHLGEPCQGTGTDQCFDGVITCEGCKKTGPEKVEICNGVDDNCNGIIDADCEVGDCEPTLLVTGSTPSSPECFDFPVQAGSKGTLNYPCGGGPVTATLGQVPFSGTVTGGFVSLDGVLIITPDQSPDGCTWKTTHHIEGVIPSGKLAYSYGETLIEGVNCWSPCTETGTVQILWTPSPLRKGLTGPQRRSCHWCCTVEVASPRRLSVSPSAKNQGSNHKV